MCGLKSKIFGTAEGMSLSLRAFERVKVPLEKEREQLQLAKTAIQEQLKVLQVSQVSYSGDVDSG